MGEGICQKCKDWHGCVGKEWFGYHEIRWCPFQVIWILRNTEAFAINWPIEPDRATNPESGKKQAKQEASFVKPKLIIAELYQRLEKCGVAGKLLAAQARANENMGMLEPEAWEALMYVKGWKRKKMSFSTWKKAKKYYHKVTIEV